MEQSQESKLEITSLKSQVSSLRTEVDSLKLQLQDQQKIEGQAKYFAMMYSLAKQEIDDLQSKLNTIKQ